MESVEREKASLISGIETDARDEEEKIIKEAETQAAEKRKYSEKKIESLLDEARTKAQEQAEAARKKIISTAEREVKRSMRVRDEVMQDIMARVEEKLGSMIDGDNYRSALAGWLTEAAIGLDAETALVSASAEELKLIDDNMLSEVKDRFHGQTGKHVALTLSDAQPLQSQGVVLTAADGRTAYSNQVRTRMLRYKREIQTLIHSTLFADSKKE